MVSNYVVLSSLFLSSYVYYLKTLQYRVYSVLSILPSYFTQRLICISHIFLSVFLDAFTKSGGVSIQAFSRNLVNFSVLVLYMRLGYSQIYLCILVKILYWLVPYQSNMCPYMSLLHTYNFGCVTKGFLKTLYGPCILFLLSPNLAVYGVMPASFTPPESLSFHYWVSSYLNSNLLIILEQRSYSRCQMAQ